MQTKTKIIISCIVILIGIFIFGSEYFHSKKIEVYDYMNELYYSETISDVMLDEIEEDDEEEQEEDVQEENKENNEENRAGTSYTFNNEDNKSVYIGYLIIPEINFKKGFTEKDSKYNTVNQNIEVLSPSDYPNVDKGNFIIAGHSGNSSISYFNKLYMLSVGSTVIVDYNGLTYTYKINNIYEVPKTGKVEIVRDKNKTTITLITCTKNNKTAQTIYIGELINIE